MAERIVSRTVLEPAAEPVPALLPDGWPTDLDIPVHDGVQAQGDVIVVPLALLPDRFYPEPDTDVPPCGVELLRGQHPHLLMADAETCRYQALGPGGLDLAVVEASAPVHLLHPEHGGLGIAPGRYVVRRQREHPGQQAAHARARRRLVVD